MHFLCNMRCFAQFFCAGSLSRPARGGWIEIWRGSLPAAPTMSRPARGGWIEIPASRFPWPESSGPAPQGASGLKFAQPGRAALWTRPAPQGAGGLKWRPHRADAREKGPAPRGAGSLSFGSFFPAMYGTEYRRRRIMRFGPRQGSAAVRSLTSCCARRPRSFS